MGKVGSGSNSPSESSASPESENGNRPRANSISDTPSDQTSDLIVYGAPWIRSGYTVSLDPSQGTHAHISTCANKGVGDGVDQLARNTKITNLDITCGIC